MHNVLVAIVITPSTTIILCLGVKSLPAAHRTTVPLFSTLAGITIVPTSEAPSLLIIFSSLFLCYVVLHHFLVCYQECDRLQ